MKKKQFQKRDVYNELIELKKVLQNSDFAKNDKIKDLLNDMNEYILPTIRKENFFIRLFANLRIIKIKLSEELIDKFKKDSAEIIKEELMDKYGMNAASKFIFNPKVAKYKNILTEYLRFVNGMERKDKEYKVYPYNAKDDLKEAYNIDIQHIAEKLLEGVSVDKILDNYIRNYEKVVKDIKDELINASIEPYYGNETFLKQRSQNILTGVSRIMQADCNVNLKTKANDVLPNLVDILYNINTLSVGNDKEKYRQLESLYLQAKAIEDTLIEDVEKEWKDFLTEPVEFKEGERFAFLLHSYDVDIKTPNEKRKACLTLVTDKVMTMPYGNVGVLYPMKMKNVVAISELDAGSWIISKKDFIEKGMPNEWQFAEKSGAGREEKVYFELPVTYSRLVLPQDVEKNLIETNLSINKEMLNYDRANLHSEIYMENEERDCMPNAMFFNVTLENKDDEKTINKLAEMAHRFRIPFIKIDKSIYREKMNLAPYTEQELKEEKSR